MARIRTVKPDFWRDEDLSGVSAEAALLAIGLLNVSDDEGYFKAHPKLIEADIFPLRELSITTTGMLSELEGIGYIELFTGSDGKKYGYVLGFSKHQVISKAKPSEIKELVRVMDGPGTVPVSVPSGKEGKGREEEREREEEGRDPLSKKTESEISAKEISSHLAEKILSRNAKAKLNPDSWIPDIEKSIRIDKRSKQDLIEVIGWIYSEGEFWVPNIMSGKKLRDKFDTIFMQKNKKSQTQLRKAPEYIPPEQRGFGSIIESTAVEI